MMGGRIRVAIILATVLALVALGAASAKAEALQPWFHLSSASRPGRLPSGLAESEIQHLTINATKGEVLIADSSKFAQVIAELEEFLEGKRSRESLQFMVIIPYNESAAALQTELQAKVFPARKVLVTGGPGDEEGNKPYEIVFPGQAVEPIFASGEFPAFIGGEALSCEGALGPNCTHEASVAELSKGKPDAHLAVTAINVGDGTANALSTPITLTDRLPTHVHAVSVEANSISNGRELRGNPQCELRSSQEVRCTLLGTFEREIGHGLEFLPDSLPPFARIEAVIAVEVGAGASSGELNEAGISGAGAPPALLRHPVAFAGKPGEATSFGVETYEQTIEEPGGVPATQAGSHPFQLTTTLDLNQDSEGQPVALAKDLSFQLPPGLVGNPTAHPRCSDAQFSAGTCPADTVVGVADVTFEEEKGGGLTSPTDPIYNLEPSVGEPARFGFRPLVPVYLDTSLRTGGDYGVTVRVSNIPQAIAFVSNTETFWGVPGDPRHDSIRGEACLNETYRLPIPGVCPPPEETNPQPFLALPTSCTGPLSDGVQADPWTEPHTLITANSEPRQAPLEGVMQALDGCGLLPFGAQITASADGEAASTPSGAEADVHVPQADALNAKGLAPADLRNIIVTLPEGVQLNPSAADGLEACTQQQVALSSAEESSCPNGSKVATATITTPLLPNPLKGFVYLASPQNLRGGPLENPFGSLVAVYLVAKDSVSGTLVKLAGSVALSPSGQITATFANNPQLPFEDADIEFFGGERAPLATPARCGTYTTNASFEPWSNTETIHEVLHSTSAFNISTGVNGSPCPGSSLPFAPSLASETTNINAGSFSPLSTTLSREDGQQNIQSVQLHFPPGVSGLLAGVKLCGETEANAGTCGPGSEIGETIVSVGLGGDPFTVTGGRVFLTEKYDGAPFGLSIVDPAKAGPFDLQEGRPVIVRAKIEVNPTTAALTITTDPSGPHAIPTIIEGFPLQIKHVNVTINRPGFTFNPTSCNPMSIIGAVDGAEGASSPVSVPFQVTNCSALKFTPKFSASTSGHTSKAKGASLSVKLSYAKMPFGSQANIAKVKVDLPKQLPSRLTTLQKACTAAQFGADPAGCPVASIVGHAKVITPLLPVSLEGPAYFVSHGGEAFPSLVIVLQGYGVTVDLVGTTFISKQSITSSTFKSTPDVPFNMFELTLPEGKFSALAALGSLCRSGLRLTMPTAFVAQSGVVIDQSTKINVTGCAKHKATRVGKAGKRKKGKHRKK
jgi:hypothetical protein